MTDYKQKYGQSTRIRTVTNRRGESEPVDLERIRSAIAFAVRGFTDAEGEPLQTNKLESAFHGIARDGMKTSEIQAELVECAKKLFDAKEEPQWLRVAGVLHAVNYVKDTATARGWGYDRFPYTALHLEEKGHYSDALRLNYTLDELEEAGSWIDPSRDYLFDIAGAELLAKRYLLPEELPQEAFLATALAAAVPSGDRKLEFAKEIYDAVSLKKISLATPVLGNLRTPGGSPTSCFISSMEDSLESIMRTAADVARISKNGGGCGINVTRIRATGSPVGGREGASGGIVPWIKILNDVLVGVNQGGRRAGAGTVSLDIWHADVPEFLELQTEAGDKRRKAYDIFPQLVVPDEFMRRARDGRDWTLCCPYEVKQKLGIDLPPLWGEAFESAYAEVEAAIADGTLKVGKVVSAKKLFVKVLQTQIETGMPYLWFKDTANRTNPNKHDGYIPGGNLCVAPETRILTDKGQIPIVELEGQFANVWNGFEWSEVMVRKTGENQPLLKVHFSNGEALECTYYHHFWVKNSGKPMGRDRVEAKDLKPGIHEVYPFDLPNKLGETTYEGIKIEKVEHTGRVSDTYCFTEPKRNLGVFNGILTGQCQESWSNVDGDRLIHSCDLASVNLANVNTYEELRSACRTAVELLDNVKAIAVSPVKGAKFHNDRYNTIGVGAMGLADWLAVRGLTHRSLSDIGELFEEFAFYCTQRSAELAVERGAYGAFHRSEWSDGNLLGAKSPEWFRENSRRPERWERLARKISETGIRNSHVTAIAPNTSSSILQGCTASILPVFKRGFFNQGEKSRNPVAPPHLSAETWWHYLENCKLDQRIVVDAVAEMQKWVDTGISMELIFNPNPGVLPFPVDAPHVRDTIFRAWEKGCKAIYYVRTVQKDSVGVDRECGSCAN